ncbi:MAG: SDR family NAD(P)-dependent oxidoreductase, partial [Acidobacteria bacterium]|nr:SDR family NAD(P)-dependent oxidoreductase [Acidobacteriota bacterium]
GRAALVTGGGSGIGLAIARALAWGGASVALGGRRRDVVEAAAADLCALGLTSVAVAGDVSSADGARRLVDEAARELDGLDILVNCAGVYRAGPLAAEHAAGPDPVDLVVDIDLKGVLFVTRAAIPHLRASGGGAIVNISSSLTQLPLANCSVYSAAKAGVDALTRNLAAELAADRIRVNAVLPGVVRTPIFETIMPPGEAAAFLDGFGDEVPLGRIGEPDDVARAAVFLCDPANDWITGALLAVDGGLSLGSR